MKKISEYTVRGILPEATTEEMIRLFDGRFDTGFRITEFIVWAQNVSSSSNDVCARLSTEPLGAMPSSGEILPKVVCFLIKSVILLEVFSLKLLAKLPDHLALLLID